MSTKTLISTHPSEQHSKWITIHRPSSWEGEPTLESLQAQITELTQKLQEATTRAEGEHEALVKERQKASGFEKDAKFLAKVKAKLGDLNPEALAEIEAAWQSAQTRDEDQRAAIAQAVSEALAKKDADMKPVLDELTTSRDNYLGELNGLKTRAAFSKLIATDDIKGRASEVDALIALAASFMPYDPAEAKFSEMKGPNGDPLFIDGKPATAQQVALKMRQGEYGHAIAACFEPWNQAGGGGLPPNGANGKPITNWQDLSITDRMAAAFSQGSNT